MQAVTLGNKRARLMREPDSFAVHAPTARPATERTDAGAPLLPHLPRDAAANAFLAQRTFGEELMVAINESSEGVLVKRCAFARGCGLAAAFYADVACAHAASAAQCARNAAAALGEAVGAAVDAPPSEEDAAALVRAAHAVALAYDLAASVRPSGSPLEERGGVHAAGHELLHLLRRAAAGDAGAMQASAGAAAGLATTTEFAASGCADRPTMILNLVFPWLDAPVAVKMMPHTPFLTALATQPCTPSESKYNLLAADGRNVHVMSCMGLMDMGDGATIKLSVVQ